MASDPDFKGTILFKYVRINYAVILCALSSALRDKTRSSAIADKLRELFCKVVEVLQDFLSENVDKKFTTDYNVQLEAPMLISCTM